MLLCRGCALAAVSGCEGLNSVPPEVDTGPDTPLDTGQGATGTQPTGPGPECSVVAQPGAGGWSSISLDDVPELADVNGWAQVSVGGRTLNIAQVEADCYVAMGTSCSHQGQRVEYVPSRGQFVCVTGHGAVFVNDGTPILGPTAVPMDTYPCARDGNSIWVNVS